ncbi:carbohydrate ABC transporter permease [Kribbella sindirgiensis]|uniref:Carbohydrate ABC transporter permease n=1 Tax=Kribbella sindirgiensis TaxID=1124744 RepID=A0A4R0IG10_9ACTN|nr:carbohydrate ABC transporter permease [Kribbella sindirgiensis]TCC32223.1 carbohydrate ABC transporter permease [Kribbella sindirgiensis]
MRFLHGAVRPLLVYLFLAWCLAPILWLVSTSLKSDVQAFSPTPVWVFTPQWGNYLNAWQEGGMSQAMLISTTVATASSVAGVICGVPLAYLVTQVWPTESKASGRVTLLILLLTTLPPILGLTPMFRTLYAAQLSQTIAGITLIHAFYAVLLAFLIFRSFLVGFPREIREAGLVDGIGEWRILGRCVIPNLVGPMFATLVLALIQSWNEFLYALILTNGATQTVPVRVSGFLSFVGTNWSNLTAAGVIGTLPIVVFALLTRKYMARGLTFGGVK